MVRNEILTSAVEVLKRSGTDGFTIAAVASEAGCAKGLINYHYQTKSRLLTAVADRVVNNRIADRIAALSDDGTEGLDRLWRVINDSVTDGRTLAWLSLLGHPEAAIREAASWPEGYASQLAAAVASSLGTILDPAQLQHVISSLDGFEIALWGGTRAELVEEAYQTMWLATL